MSPLQQLLFMKFFRSDTLYRLIQDFLNESFKNIFSSASSSSLEQITFLNSYTRPTIVFYTNINICYNTLFEMKSFRLNLKKSLARIALSNDIYEITEKELDQAVKEQKWVLIEKLDNLSEKNQLKLFKKLNNICGKITENSRFRIWIFYQVGCQKILGSNNSALNSFVYSCTHVFLHSSGSLRAILSVLFSNEKEEHKGKLSQKAQKVHMKTINMKTYASKAIKVKDIVFLLNLVSLKYLICSIFFRCLKYITLFFL